MIGSSIAHIDSESKTGADSSSTLISPSFRTSGFMPTLRCRSDAFASHISLKSRSIGGDVVGARGARGAMGAIGARGATGAMGEEAVAGISATAFGALTDSTKPAAAGPLAAITAPTDVVSITNSGSDFGGCGEDVVSVGDAASPGSIETDTFSPSRRRATLNT